MQERDQVLDRIYRPVYQTATYISCVYADDLVIFSPSSVGLRALIAVHVKDMVLAIYI